MWLLEWICIFILGAYAIFILCNIAILFLRKKAIPALKKFTPTMPVSIIIAARNEEQNIVKCLQSISAQEFSKGLSQIIVVDDNSSDDTVPLAKKFLEENFNQYILISLSKDEKGKKTAIQKGIEQSTGSIIITRDADTYTGDPLWLKSIVYHFQYSSCDLLISPVILKGNNSFISTFQQFENLAISSLGQSTAYVNLPFVCSGANLAYKKEKFVQAKPYQNNLAVASGDDMFLLKYFYLHKFKIKANISNAALVYTPAENSLKAVFSQRIRWASKSGKINIFPVFFTGSLVLLANLASLFALGLPFINRHYLTFSLLCLTLKFIIDFLLLFLSARRFKEKVNWSWLPLAFLVNSLYVLVIMFTSIIIKPNWKARTI